MNNRQLPRRTFLRGMGTAIALPMLEAMLPSGVLAVESAQQAAPLRMAFIFIPNGVIVPDWKPTQEGTDFELPATLQPLLPFKDDFNVLTGLAHDKANPNGDGPGDHARSAAVFLTGNQPRKTSGADIKAGISVDQLAAQAIGDQTQFPSLELGCERGPQAGKCDSTYSCAYSTNISWRTESTPMSKEIDPRLVFERLFSDGSKRDVGAAFAKRTRYQKSVLDFVLEDARRLKSTLGGKDRKKLDEYLTGVREIEKRISGMESRAKVKIAGVTGPGGIPEDYGEHVRLMYDMLVLAFQSDLTRISSFMSGNAGSNRSFPTLGVPDGHHSLSHHREDEKKIDKLRKIDRFQIEQLAYFLGKLKSIKEGEGTLLDNCAIVYGSSISDGNHHTHNDLPVLLAGRMGSAINSGRHIRFEDNTPMNNLYLSLLNRIGVQVDSFGDSTGQLERLDG